MKKSKRVAINVLIVLVDFLLLISAFYLVAYIKPGTSRPVLEEYEPRFWLFALLWIGVSLWFDKYNFKHHPGTRSFLRPVLVSNFVIVGLVSITVVLVDSFEVSRFLFFGVTGAVTFVEILLAGVSLWFFNAASKGYYEETDQVPVVPSDRVQYEPAEVTEYEPVKAETAKKAMVEAIREESGAAVLDYLCSHLPIGSTHSTVLATTTRFNVINLPDNHYSTIVNLKRINDIQRINKFFESVNAKLPVGGLFAGCAETYVMRKQRILKKFPPGVNYLMYSLDFLIKRVMPKLYVTKNIYFFITRGNNRVISRAETLGRLYSCGFEVVREDFLNGMLYFIVKKVKEPAFDFHPTYGPLIKLKRIGENGNMIGVFKMRTMHAYSEYLQKYVFEQNNLQDGGKFADDFRVTTLGKFMRSCWLDELPMFINLLKGDLKLVGVRPLSRHYFSLYSDELQKFRIKFKPGLIPPFYVDMPVTLEEIMESERRYLEAYERSPFLTDWRYFWRSLYNIFIKRARSK